MSKSSAAEPYIPPVAIPLKDLAAAKAYGDREAARWEDHAVSLHGPCCEELEKQLALYVHALQVVSDQLFLRFKELRRQRLAAEQIGLDDVAAWPTEEAQEKPRRKQGRRKKKGEAVPQQRPARARREEPIGEPAPLVARKPQPTAEQVLQMRGPGKPPGMRAAGVEA